MSVSTTNMSNAAAAAKDEKKVARLEHPERPFENYPPWARLEHPERPFENYPPWFLIPTLNTLKDEKLADAKTRVSKSQAEWDAYAFARSEWCHMYGQDIPIVEMFSTNKLASTGGMNHYRSQPTPQFVFQAKYRPEFTASEYKLDTLWGERGHPVTVYVCKDVSGAFLPKVKEGAEAILVEMISGNRGPWLDWSTLRARLVLQYTDDQDMKMSYSSLAFGGEAAYMCLIRDAFDHMQHGSNSKEVPRVAQVVETMIQRYSLEKSTVDALKDRFLMPEPAAVPQEGEIKLFKRVVVNSDSVDADDTDAVEEFVSRMEEELECLLNERICNFYIQFVDRSFYEFSMSLNPPELSEADERKNLGEDLYICSGSFFLDVKHFLQTEHKMDIDTPMIPERRLRALLDERYGTLLDVIPERRPRALLDEDDEGEDEDESPKASKRKPTDAADADDEDVARASKRTRSA